MSMAARREALAAALHKIMGSAGAGAAAAAAAVVAGSSGAGAAAASAAASAAAAAAEGPVAAHAVVVAHRLPVLAAALRESRARASGEAVVVALPLDGSGEAASAVGGAVGGAGAGGTSAGSTSGGLLHVTVTWRPELRRWDVSFPAGTRRVVLAGLAAYLYGDALAAVPAHRLPQLRRLAQALRLPRLASLCAAQQHAFDRAGDLQVEAGAAAGGTRTPRAGLSASGLAAAAGVPSSAAVAAASGKTAAADVADTAASAAGGAGAASSSTASAACAPLRAWASHTPPDSTWAQDMAAAVQRVDAAASPVVAAAAAAYRTGAEASGGAGADAGAGTAARLGDHHADVLVRVRGPAAGSAAADESTAASAAGSRSTAAEPKGDCVFALHKLVLSRSAYFRTLLHGAFAEAAAAGASIAELLIEDVDPCAFHAIVEYLYTGNLSHLAEDADSCMGALALAAQFCMTDLCARLQDIVAASVDPADAGVLLDFADTHGLPRLVKLAKALKAQ